MLLYTLAAVGARGPPELATMGAAAYKAVFRILFRISATLLDPDPDPVTHWFSWISILDAVAMNLQRWITVFESANSLAGIRYSKSIGCVSPQIVNPQIFMINPQICKFLQNSAQLCLKTYLKVVF